MNRLLLGVFVATVTVFSSNPSFADNEQTGARRITQLGCSRVEQPGGECFVTLEGAAFGPAECRSTQARWAPQKENGRSILALLMAAWASDERVNIALEGACWIQPSSASSPRCNDPQASPPCKWPWVSWVNVYHVGDAPP